MKFPEKPFKSLLSSYQGLDGTCSLGTYIMRDYVSFKGCDHRSLNISSCSVAGQWRIGDDFSSCMHVLQALTSSRKPLLFREQWPPPSVRASLQCSLPKTFRPSAVYHMLKQTYTHVYTHL